MDDHIPTLIEKTAAQGAQIAELRIDVAELKVIAGEIRDTLNIQRGQRKALYAVLAAGIPGGGLVGGYLSKLIGGQ